MIRLVQALLYTGTIISTIGLGKAIYGSSRTGIWAGLLLAIPTVNVTLYTTASLGGYGEALLIGNLILLAALRIANDINGRLPDLKAGWPGLGLGLLAGVGLWANGLTLIYTLPAGLMLLIMILRHRGPVNRRHALEGCAGGAGWFWDRVLPVVDLRVQPGLAGVISGAGWKRGCRGTGFLAGPNGQPPGQPGAFGRHRAAGFPPALGGALAGPAPAAFRADLLGPGLLAGDSPVEKRFLHPAGRAAPGRCGWNPGGWFLVHIVRSRPFRALFCAPGDPFIAGCRGCRPTGQRQAALAGRLDWVGIGFPGLGNHRKRAAHAAGNHHPV